MRVKSIAGVFMGISVLLSACSNQSQQTGAVQTAGMEADLTESGVEAAAEDKPEEAAEEIIRIIHVNDIHGYVEETEALIGYPKLAAYIDQMKEEYPNTLALDAGDTYSGSPEASFDKGESIFPILNTIAFDAMTLGNHDVYLGEERLTSLIERMNYPVLGGNIKASQGSIWEDYTIVTLANGMKVGMIAATTTAPAGAEFLSVVDSTQRLVDLVKPQTDVVVALVHLGTDETFENNSQMIADGVTGIDVIIDGHSHTVLEEGMVVNDILIAQTGEYGNYVGLVELTLKGDTVVSAAARLLSKEDLAAVEDKPETRQAVDELMRKSDEYFAQEAGETAVDLVAARELIRTGETNMGNLYADIVRETLGAELAICAAGNIGGDIPAGVITKKDILQMARVDVTFTLADVTGEFLLKLLNISVGDYPEPSGRFAQVSGMTYEFNPELEAGDRITAVVINGEPLEPQRTYRAAINSLLLNGHEEPVIVEVHPEMSSVILENYISRNPPVNPEVEGRITIIKE